MCEMQKERWKVSENKQLKTCPFCGCSMGILFLDGGCEWYGRHESLCPLESNPSAFYGHVGDMVDAWNMRAENTESVTESEVEGEA